MSRIVMYVFNDARHDSRVRREAATLAALGHDVTVMATASAASPEDQASEIVDGFRIVRLAVPIAWRGRWDAVATPGMFRRRSLGRAIGALRRGPSAWSEIPVAIGLAAASLVVSAIRLGFLTAVKVAGRPAPRSAWPPASVRWLASWRWSTLAWNHAAAQHAPVADVHHGHDLTALRAAIDGARRDGTVAVYDSHEIFVDSGSNARRPAWARRLLRSLERRWSRETVALVTVNRAYASVLERRLNPARIAVVHNCPPRWLPPDDLGRLRSASGILDDAPIVLYHGAFSRYRGLEELAEAIVEPSLGSVHLVYLGYGTLRPDLDRWADDPRFGGRLHVLDAVLPDDLLELVAGADIDAIPLQHSTLNHYLCTPNKLFESLSAGVPVVASDFPEMRRILLDDPLGPLGVVCDPADPRDLAAAIQRVLARDPTERVAIRERCRKAAFERWNWETESVALTDLYADLLNRPGTGPG